MRRLTLLLVIVMSLLLAAGCGQYGKRYKASSDNTGANGEEPRLTEKDFEDDKVRVAESCDEMVTKKSEGRTHTTSLDEKVDYKSSPPMSGNHYQVAVDWGLYPTQTKQDEELVHNLEHGHLLIQFKGLSQADTDKVYEHARINPFHLIAMPRKENPKKGVYYTAWTRQIHCKEPSKVALQYMIDNWRDQGPELFMEDPARKAD